MLHSRSPQHLPLSSETPGIAKLSLLTLPSHQLALPNGASGITKWDTLSLKALPSQKLALSSWVFWHWKSAVCIAKSAADIFKSCSWNCQVFDLSKWAAGITKWETWHCQVSILYCQVKHISLPLSDTQHMYVVSYEA